MTLFFISFIAGILTVLAPCILPLLPVIIGSSVACGSRKRAYVIIASLMVSVLLFTFLLKASTALINIPQSFWSYFSGGLIIILAISLLFPTAWGRVPLIGKISVTANRAMGTGYKKESVWGDIIIGMSLGPVFSTCSPTYFLILATVLPASFGLGLVYLVAYALGLGLILLLISIAGEKIVQRLGTISDSRGLFKKGLGILFLIVGLFIITGYDKKIESRLLDTKVLGVTSLEEKLLEKVDGRADAENAKQKSQNNSAGVVELGDYGKYAEIASPSAFLNTGGKPITIGESIGKEVVLVDFMTYSCINCIRTFPQLVAWDTAYRQYGLRIIGIHTPEFAFEHKTENVAKALKEYNITFPVVLDNDYGTWRAYKNSYWPRKYIIDTEGTIVYDHIGEGEYRETEMVIRKLLVNRARLLGLDITLPPPVSGADPDVFARRQSPETYLGNARNEHEYRGNGKELPLDSFRLDGVWHRSGEFIQSVDGARITYKFSSGKVFVVAESASPVSAKVLLDGSPIPHKLAGSDVTNSTITFSTSKLYELVDLPESGTHELEIVVDGAGAQLYAFTFGK